MAPPAGIRQHSTRCVATIQREAAEDHQSSPRALALRCFSQRPRWLACSCRTTVWTLCSSELLHLHLSLASTSNTIRSVVLPTTSAAFEAHLR